MQSLTRPKLWKSANKTQLREVPLPVSILGQATRCRKGLHLAGVVAEDPAALFGLVVSNPRDTPYG